MSLMSVLSSDLFLTFLSTSASIGLPFYFNRLAYNHPHSISPPKDHLISKLAQKILGTDLEVRVWVHDESKLSSFSDETPLQDVYIPVKTEGSAILGYPLLYMDPAYDALPNEKKEFMIAHELSHIARNDFPIQYLYSSARGTVQCLGFKQLWKNLSLKAFCISVFALGIIYKMSKSLYCYQEKCADLNGFAACSKEGKKEAIQLFESSRKANLKIRESILAEEAEQKESDFLSKLNFFLLKQIYSKEGNFGLDLFHPPLTERISYLKEAFANEYNEVVETVGNTNLNN